MIYHNITQYNIIHHKSGHFHAFIEELHNIVVIINDDDDSDDVIDDHMSHVDKQIALQDANTTPLHHDNIATTPVLQYAATSSYGSDAMPALKTPITTNNDATGTLYYITVQCTELYCTTHYYITLCKMYYKHFLSTS